MAVPASLMEALRPVTVVVGHYGAGKTNFSVNLALDLKAAGHEVAIVDLDVVNPYFRASEQRVLLEEHGVRLVAPVFAEAGTSLDVPSLSGQIVPTIDGAGEGSFVIVDAGGDDVGATALGRFSRHVFAHDYAMIYVANRFRNLVQDPADAVENLREIEAASHLKATGIVNNSHLKESTNAEVVSQGIDYADELARLSGLPLVCTTVPQGVEASGVADAYPVAQHVRTIWEN